MLTNRFLNLYKQNEDQKLMGRCGSRGDLYEILSLLARTLFTRVVRVILLPEISSETIGGKICDLHPLLRHLSRVSS